MSISKKISYMSELHVMPSLSILLEEDEDKFDMPDKDSTGSTDSSDSTDSTGSTDDSSDLEVAQIDSGQLDTLTRQLDALEKTILKTSDDGTQSVESYIVTAISESLSESKKQYHEKSLNNFIILEDDSKKLKKIEKDIDVLDRVLTKGNDLVSKFKNASEVNISSYVDAAINAYRNFDSLFAKEKIVKQATINVLVLNSGAKAEANVQEFEELFHQELYKKFGIEYEKYALVTKKSVVGVGATKQG